jgi:hypothetical protein
MDYESTWKHAKMPIRHEPNSDKPKSDEQSFSQPHRNFTEHLMSMTEILPWEHINNEEKSSLLIQRLKTIPTTLTRTRIAAQEKSTVRIEEQA